MEATQREGNVSLRRFLGTRGCTVPSAKETAQSLANNRMGTKNGSSLGKETSPAEPNEHLASEDGNRSVV